MWNQRRIHATGGREATRYWSMNSWHKTSPLGLMGTNTTSLTFSSVCVASFAPWRGVPNGDVEWYHSTIRSLPVASDSQMSLQKLSTYSCKFILLEKKLIAKSISVMWHSDVTLWHPIINVKGYHALVSHAIENYRKYPVLYSSLIHSRLSENWLVRDRINAFCNVYWTKNNKLFQWCKNSFH